MEFVTAPKPKPTIQDEVICDKIIHYVQINHFVYCHRSDFLFYTQRDFVVVRCDSRLFFFVQWVEWHATHVSVQNTPKYVRISYHVHHLLRKEVKSIVYTIQSNFTRNVNGAIVEC